ncbi:DUF2283 domain-containing protein [bacterium]|nr:DUF2283 domain-containing protein [bacterium]
MEAVKILEDVKQVNWKYDEEADILYLSLGEPKKAEGIDVVQGVIVRYDEERKDVVGLTILGMRTRLLESLS